MRDCFRGAALVAPVAWIGFVSGANASDTRISVLAHPAGLSDPSYLFAYPGLAAGESRIFGELGQPNSDAYGGVLYTTDYGTFGLFVSRDASLMQSRGTVVADSPDWITTATQPFLLSRKYLSTLPLGPSRPVDIVYARALGAGKAGVRLTWASDLANTDNGTVKTETSSDQVDLQLGYSAAVAGGQLDTGLKVGIIGDVKTSTTNGGTKLKDEYTRGVSLRGSARHVLPLDSSKDFVTKFGFFYEHPEIEASNGGTSQSKNLTEQSVDVSAGLTLKPRAGTKVFAGGTMFYMVSKGPFSFAAPNAQTPVTKAVSLGTETLARDLAQGTSSKTAMGLIASASVEAEMSQSWLLLAGLGYPLMGNVTAKDKVTAGNPKHEARLSDVEDASLWSFGVGYLHEALRVDAGVSAKSFLHNGPFLITGNQTKAPVLFVVSASYDLAPSTQEPVPSSSIAIPPAPPVQTAPVPAAAQPAAPASVPKTR
jgi:hypothetical protein